MKKNNTYQSDFGRHRLIGGTPARQLIQNSVSEAHGGLDVLLGAGGVCVAHGRGHPVSQPSAGAQVGEAERRTVQDVQVRAATQVLCSLLGLVGEVLGAFPHSLGDLSVQVRRKQDALKLADCYEHVKALGLMQKHEQKNKENTPFNFPQSTVRSLHLRTVENCLKRSLEVGLLLTKSLILYL